MENKKSKRAVKIVLNILLWLFVALAALMVVLSLASQKSDSGLPQMFGRSPISILSDSMKPEFKKGDLIIGKNLSSDEQGKLKINDIITFYTDLDGDGRKNELNTHRIIDIFEENGYVFYTTKGDNPDINKEADKIPVAQYEVLALYNGTRLPFVGSAMDYLKTPNGFLICIVIPLILFFLFQIYRFISVVVAAKNEKAVEELAISEEEIKRKAVEEYLAAQAAESEKAEEGETVPDEPAEETQAAPDEPDTENGTAEE